VDLCWPRIWPILTTWWLLYLCQQVINNTFMPSPLPPLPCIWHNSLVLSIFQHISPWISLLTRLRSPRTASTVVAHRLEDSEVGPSTLALSDRIVYRFHIPLYIYHLFFLSEHSLASSSTLELPYLTLHPPLYPLISKITVQPVIGKTNPFTFPFSLYSTHLLVAYLSCNHISPTI